MFSISFSPGCSPQRKETVFDWWVLLPPFMGCMYQLQTWSKNTRREAVYWNREFNYDKVYSQIYKMYFKKYYNGKPTKRYLRLL